MAEAALEALSWLDDPDAERAVLKLRGSTKPEYREAVAADGSFAPAWLNLGLLLERMGRKAEAADAF